MNTLHGELRTLVINLAEIFLEWYTFQTKFEENIKTKILCCDKFFLNRAFYDVMWKNVIKQVRP
jgi:hypothetical protein